MTLTLTPKTEALLRAKAKRDGEDADTLADLLLGDLLAREQEEEVEALRLGFEASDAGRVRPLAVAAAEMRAKYNLPTHLSDEEIFADEAGFMSR